MILKGFGKICLIFYLKFGNIFRILPLGLINKKEIPKFRNYKSPENKMWKWTLKSINLITLKTCAIVIEIRSMFFFFFLNENTSASNVSDK